MSMTEFLNVVKERGWTLAELRFDVLPPDSLLQWMGEAPIDETTYERYVLALERGVRKALAKRN